MTTTPGFHNALAELAQRFAQQLPERMLDFRRKLDQLSPDAWQEDKAVEFYRLMHSLTGAADTFGMLAVGDAARRLEHRLYTVLKHGSVPEHAVWAEVRADFAQLLLVLQSSSAHSLVQPCDEMQNREQRPLICLIEGDQEQAQHLERMLAMQNYRVHTFTSLESFRLSRVGGECPEAVVMEMAFPDESAGGQIVTEFKAAYGVHIPVVFVDARDDMAAYLAAYRAGATRYLSKPIDDVRLARMLRELIAQTPMPPYRILLVDDDPLLNKIHATILGQAGMEVSTLSEPLKILDVVRELKPDVVVLDVYMPDASGPELAAVLREQDAFLHLPILFLSAEADMDKQLLALNLGGDDFLVKPVNPEHLVTAIAARARRVRQRDEMTVNLKRILYEREREHLALDKHAIVSIADAAGRIIYVNDKFCEISGYAREELLGKNHRIVKSAEHPPELYREMWRTISTGNIWHGLVCNQRKDGSLYWVESTIVPFLDAHGKPYQYVSIRTDITALQLGREELRTARDKAESASRAKSDFLSSMSHELRTPLNAVLGFGQLLELDERLAPDQKDNAQEILKAGEHLLGLVNEVLDLARIESGKIDISPEPIDASVLMGECCNLIEPLAHARQISMQCGDWGDLWVYADRIRIKQVLINLLSNAVKYNHERGSIRLDWQRPSPDHVRITVSDTGPGITAERIGELFQPFSRLGAEHSAIEGTGIGLAITRKLIEMMGGSVGVESMPGVGSTFWVELPQAPFEVEHAHTEAHGDSAMSAHGARMQRVLYIEDNPTNLKLVSQILERRRHIRLVTAHTPESGMEFILAHQPDLILLDINMPGMDGYQVLEILKMDARSKGIPVIALTANAMPNDIERGRPAGFAAYLTKPLDVEGFLKTVDDTLLECASHTSGNE